MSFTKKEASIVNSLNDIDLVLDKAIKNATFLNAELDDVEKKIKNVTNTSKEFQKKIKISEE